MDPFDYSEKLNHLNTLAAEANTSIKTSKAHLNSTYQKTVLWLAKTGAIDVPAWAKDHLIITEKLKEAVQNLEGYTEIPKEIKKTLKKSKKMESLLAQIIPPEKFLELVQSKGSFSGQDKLLIGQAEIPPSAKEWRLNLGLIVKVYKVTTDPELRKKLSFMAVQYLAKAAAFTEGRTLMEAQITSLGQSKYHRETDYQFLSGKQARTFLVSDLAYSLTDPTSLQWFALANKYAAKQVDGCRKLIFQNCRKVLNQVPVQLQPTNNSKVWVCEVDEAMDPAFIDIKVVGKNAGEFESYLKEELLSTFKKNGMEMYTRASF